MTKQRIDRHGNIGAKAAGRAQLLQEPAAAPTEHLPPARGMWLG
ncbi:hypothetical protein ACFZCT_32235 [Streptomyces qaidamensis]